MNHAQFNTSRQDSGTMDKVLFVDDEASILSSFRRIMKSEFEVHTANSGAEALEIIKTKGPFAVIVSDLKMPKMDGISFLSEARKADPEAVRMVLTGYANLENAIQAVNEGHVFRIITKPCTNENIIKAVKNAVEQYNLIMSQVELQALRRFANEMEGLIKGFTNLIETRDPYTAGHQTGLRSWLWPWPGHGPGRRPRQRPAYGQPGSRYRQGLRPRGVSEPPGETIRSRVQHHKIPPPNRPRHP